VSFFSLLSLISVGRLFSFKDESLTKAAQPSLPAASSGQDRARDSDITGGDKGCPCGYVPVSLQLVLLMHTIIPVARISATCDCGRARDIKNMLSLIVPTMVVYILLMRFLLVIAARHVCRLDHIRGAPVIYSIVSRILGIQEKATYFVSFYQFNDRF
jgi:hypothetical protein